MQNKYNEHGEIVRWVADEHARRVPLFVIKSTGLKTKTKVVAKYGFGVAFEQTKDGKAKVVRKGERVEA